MSAGGRNIPSFGVTRAIRRGNNTENIGDHVILPTVNLQKYTSNQIGELVINMHDQMVYYNVGGSWKPIGACNTVDKNSRIENNTFNFEVQGATDVCFRAGAVLKGNGGDLYLSSGQGGYEDGEIYFQIGGDSALTLAKNSDLVLAEGNLILNNSRAGILSQIGRKELTVDEDHVEINTRIGILTLQLQLNTGESTTGILVNDVITEDSWISASVVAKTGCPNLWFEPPGEGTVRYHLKCSEGELTQIQIHFQVQNSF